MGSRSGIGRATLVAAVAGLALMRAPAAAQEAAHHADYRKCKTCAPALGKAMAYLKANLKSDKARRVIGSKLGGYVFGGFAFMMDGESPRELEECVRYAAQAVRDEGFNRNWYLSLGMIFLAEYALRYGFTPEVERALADGLKMAARQQEETGGWCHHLEMWKKDGYNTRGGGRDLGMITSMLYGSFVELKSLGVEVGPMMERARKNLESISDGAGVRYGTDNGVGDPAMARASWVLLGIQAAGDASHPFASKYAQGVQGRYRKIEEGVHGFAPLHYFSVAAAMHRLGPDSYAKFAAEYLDRLIATQTAAGIVPLHNEDDVASTAVFACIVMMQRDGLFRPKSRKKPAPPAEKPAAPVATEKPAPSAPDPKALAARDAELAEVVRREIREGRAPRFRFALLGQEVSIASLDESGKMSVESNGSAFEHSWAALKPGDRRDLAAALARRDVPGAAALAAFYHAACGQEGAAEEWLRRLAPAEADKVRASFPGKDRS